MKKDKKYTLKKVEEALHSGIISTHEVASNNREIMVKRALQILEFGHKGALEIWNTKG